MKDPHIGDVTLSEDGQQAVVRYIGALKGKPGRFVGLELLGEHARRGKHSGTFNGERYFATKEPDSGVFVSMARFRTLKIKDGDNYVSVSRPHSRQTVVDELDSAVCSRSSTPRSSTPRSSRLSMRTLSPPKLSVGGRRMSRLGCEQTQSPPGSPRIARSGNPNLQDEILRANRKVLELLEVVDSQNQQLASQSEMLNSMHQTVAEANQLLDTHSTHHPQVPLDDRHSPAAQIEALRKTVHESQESEQYQLKRYAAMENRLLETQEELRETKALLQAARDQLAASDKQIVQLRTELGLQIKERDQLEVLLNDRRATPVLTQPDSVPIYHSPLKVDPAAGRKLWCALCEKDGHTAQDCPFEIY